MQKAQKATTKNYQRLTVRSSPQFLGAKPRNSFSADFYLLSDLFWLYSIVIALLLRNLSVKACFIC